MTWKPETEKPETPLLVHKAAKLLPPAPGNEQKTRRGFWRTIGSLWKLLKGYTADDIDRLKEAGVQIVEGKGKVAIAEAEAKLGAAAKFHAEAELARAQAREIDGKTYVVKRDADAKYVTAAAKAAREVAEAISKIKQEGGNVAFDLNQFRSLLDQGRAEFPSDKQIPAPENDQEA